MQIIFQGNPQQVNVTEVSHNQVANVTIGAAGAKQQAPQAEEPEEAPCENRARPSGATSREGCGQSGLPEAYSFQGNHPAEPAFPQGKTSHKLLEASGVLG